MSKSYKVNLLHSKTSFVKATPNILLSDKIHSIHSTEYCINTQIINALSFVTFYGRQLEITASDDKHWTKVVVLGPTKTTTD